MIGAEPSNSRSGGRTAGSKEFKLVGDGSPGGFAMVQCRIEGMKEDVVVNKEITNTDRGEGLVVTTKEEEVVIVDINANLTKLPMIKLLEGWAGEDMRDVIIVITAKRAVIVDMSKPARGTPVVGKSEDIGRDNARLESLCLLVKDSNYPV